MDGERPRSNAWPDDDGWTIPSPEDDAWGEGALSGEHLSIPEAIIVAPARGRLRRGSVAEGALVARGFPLGAVERSNNGHDRHAIEAPVEGVFLGWLAWEGESVVQGALLARIARSVPTSDGHRSNGVGTRNGKRRMRKGARPARERPSSRPT